MTYLNTSTAQYPSAPHYFAEEDHRELPINVLEVKLIQNPDQTWGAKSVVAFHNPHTRKSEKYVITTKEVEIIDGNHQKTIDKIKFDIEHADENLKTVILLGITHLTPGSSTKKVHCENGEFSILKASNRTKSYGGESEKVLPKRQWEVYSKFQIWHTLYALSTQKRETLPVELQPIKDKLPGGPISGDEQALINKYLYIEGKWYTSDHQNQSWIDLQTQQPANRDMPPYVGVKPGAKEITQHELETIPTKLNKWEEKCRATDLALSLYGMLKPRPLQQEWPPSSMDFDSPEEKPSTEQKAEILRQEAASIQPTTAKEIRRKISLLEQIPPQYFTAKDQATLADLYNRLGNAQNNPEKKKNYYEKAAKLGSNCGAYNLGEMYRKGEEIAQNDEEALRCYERALDNDSNNPQSSPFDEQMKSACRQHIADLQAKLAGKTPQSPEREAINKDEEEDGLALIKQQADALRQQAVLIHPTTAEEIRKKLSLLEQIPQEYLTEKDRAVLADLCKKLSVAESYQEIKRKGVEAYKVGKYDEAYNLLKVALEEGNPLSKDPESLFYLGLIEKNLAKARELLRQVQELSQDEELKKKAQIKEHSLRIRELAEGFSIDGITYSLGHLTNQATFLENIENSSFTDDKKLEMIGRVEENIKERKTALGKLHRLSKQQTENAEVAELLSIAGQRILDFHEMQRIDKLHEETLNE